MFSHFDLGSYEVVSYNVFFFNDTPTTEIYTLSLHDALPIFRRACRGLESPVQRIPPNPARPRAARQNEPRGPDRKSTRLNSSHSQISYAVFCLKKKKTRSKKPRSHGY